jgi:choline dehydrogenase
MVYMRGQKVDYDYWASLGNRGWSWSDVLPYFKRAEKHFGGANEHHGCDGELCVEEPRVRWEILDAWREAAQECGIPKVEEFNRGDNFGNAYFHMNQRGGVRWSATKAFLRPAMSRPNLTVITKAHVRKLVLEGKRASAIEMAVEGRGEGVAKAAKEVILAAGSIGSPQLLQLSGIGPAALLKEHGIDVVADLPGVGENLQDHYVITSTWRLKPGTVSVNELTKGTRFLGETLKYVFQRKGLLTLSAAHIAAFCKSRPELAGPDIQFHILPATMDTEKLMAEQKMELEGEPGLTIAPCQVRPESRGSIRIRSPNPTVYPAIQPNYLSDSIDQQVAVASLRWARKIATQPALAKWIDHEMLPGPEAKTDDELLAFARMTGSTIYHPVGTCQMGHGPQAVVDPQLRVHGVQALRVVDASVMPRLVSGNTNAPTIMIAEKAADLILGKAPASALAA